MSAIQIAVWVVILIVAIRLWLTDRKNKYRAMLIAKQIDNHAELKRTLAMGLYYRFSDTKKKDRDGNVAQEKLTKLFIKQDPIQFESFVAEVVEDALGGSTWVSPASNDYGVDFEHRINGDLLLGQVKCYKNDLDYSPIALIHSNMVKRGAKGGYVITTGDFTDNAKRYARELNIDLINGTRLVSIWMKALEQTDKEIVRKPSPI